MTTRKRITPEEDKAIKKWFRKNKKAVLGFNNYTHSLKFYLADPNRPRDLSLGPFRKYMIELDMRITMAPAYRRYGDLEQFLKQMEKRVHYLESLIGPEVFERAA